MSSMSSTIARQASYRLHGRTGKTAGALPRSLSSYSQFASSSKDSTSSQANSQNRSQSSLPLEYLQNESPFNWRDLRKVMPRFDQLTDSSNGNSSSSTMNESTANEQDKIMALAKTLPHPHKMTLKERFTQFPLAFKDLYYEGLLYKSIEDALHSRRNAWQGRLPRRQFIQQQRFLQDARDIMPLFLLWIPPIIGYLPMILAVVAPRQVLTPQFTNEYERYLYAAWQANERRLHYPVVGKMLSQRLSNIQTSGHDVAGPIIKADCLFDEWVQTDLSEIDRLPRRALQAMSGSLGLYHTLPIKVSKALLQVTPRQVLTSHLKYRARLVGTDDKLLLQNCVDDNIANMTNDEVIEACQARGLPVHVPLAEQREALKKHLLTISHLPIPATTQANIDQRGLFGLQMNILREYLQNKRE
jgi:LETM1-like protein